MIRWDGHFDYMTIKRKKYLFIPNMVFDRQKYCMITKLDTRSIEGYVYSVCEVAVHEGGST